MTKIVFFGASSYCLTIPGSLFETGQLAGIVSQPDRPVGRKNILTPNPVSLFALSKNIPLLRPEKLGPSEKEWLQKLGADLFLVADYGLKIPKNIFTLPKYQALNIHFSKLPKYRGPSPVQQTLLNGDLEAGISFVVISEGFDTGDIVYQESIPLAGHETTGLLYRSLFEKTAAILPLVLEKYLSGELKPRPQEKTGISYCQKIKKEDAFVSNQDLEEAINKGSVKALEIERKIRAFSPWPGAYTNVELKIKNEKLNRRLKLLKAHLETTSANMEHGTAKHLKLTLDEVQLENKNPVSWKQFKEAYLS
ncbi:methionyl-tRNA formyltransferase [Candidatus Shapirobacteria bacterium]|nr:methionyl-tRNA formyltransferase [Candidatus Shapirobacteria bacterium]